MTDNIKVFEEAVGEILVETLVGLVVEFIGENSVIADLVADVIGEISVMFGWLPRYVETVEKIE